MLKNRVLPSDTHFANEDHVRQLPETLDIDESSYAFERILKEDFFSVNALYRHESGRRFVLKLSDHRFLFGALFRPIAMLTMRHEYKIYTRVADIRGIPALGPRYGSRGYLHEYVEGKTLFELGKRYRLPDDFFDELARIIREVHERRVFYVDLKKKGNIILDENGKPALIDFHLSQHFGKLWWPFRRPYDALFRWFIREDIYHLYKHKKKYRPDLLTEEERALTRRTRLNRAYDIFIGRGFRFCKRLIYPKGSNETVWFRWNKLREKPRQMP